jgi:hypothetical protein
MPSEIAKKWFNAIVYLACLIFLGLAASKAAVVAAMVLLCDYLGYGSRWLWRGGFALLVLTLLVFIDVVPEPKAWRALAQEAWSVFHRPILPTQTVR